MSTTNTAPPTIPATLGEFMADHKVARIWYTSTATPAGREVELNFKGTGEDYCDDDGIFDTLRYLGAYDKADAIEGDWHITGGGQRCWQAADLRDVRDAKGNSVTNLTVWGE